MTTATATQTTSWIAKQAEQGIVVSVGPNHIVVDSEDHKKLTRTVAVLMTGGRLTLEHATTEPDEDGIFWATLRIK